MIPRSPARSSLMGALIVCAVGSACSIALEPGEPQCETVADCEARGFEEAACVEQVCVEQAIEDPVWGCLGDVTEPVPDPTQRVDLAVRLVFAIEDDPVTTAVVDVCDKLDVQCMSEHPDFPKGLSPDSDGLVSVSVPEGFDGFVRITDPAIVDTRVYVGRPIVEPPKQEVIRLLKPAQFETLGLLAGGHDPERGTAIILALDCKGDGAPGVQFEVPSADEDSTEFYLVNLNPVTPPGATQTDADGFGGVFNLPATPTVARSIRATDGAFIGESSFHVLPGTISFVQIAPSPQ